VIFAGAILNVTKVTAIYGEKMKLNCSVTKLNDQQPIIWWHGKDRILMANDVIPEYQSYYSYNNKSGSLTVLKARISGIYHCGVKFSHQKQVINFTVIGKCFFPSF